MKVPWIPKDEPTEEETEEHRYYYVDKPPTPVFVPLPPGIDEEIQVIDTELFDYQLEVEPILQVIVGKTLEAARMEVIEEYERDLHLQHVREFEIRKEAELLECQRKENAQERRDKEKNRRQLQETTFKDQNKRTQQKLLARILSKDLLADMKQESLQILKDRGNLRHPSETAMQVHCWPLLQQKVNKVHAALKNREFILDDTLMWIVGQLMHQNDNARRAEKMRRDKKREDELQRLQKLAEEKEQRRIERERKKEMARQAGIKSRITDLLLNKAILNDPIEAQNFKLVDMITKETEKILFMPGSAFAPILLALSELFIISKGTNPDFVFSEKLIQSVITSFLHDFPANFEILVSPGTDIPARGIELTNELEQQIYEKLGYKNIQSLGLAMLLRKAAHNKMGLYKEVLEVFLRQFIRLHYKLPTPIISAKTVNEEELKDLPPEEVEKKKGAVEQENIEIKEKNEESEKENAHLLELQAKLNIIVLEEPIMNEDICSIVQLGTIVTEDSKEKMPIIQNRAEEITVAAIHIDYIAPIMQSVIKKLMGILDEFVPIINEEYEQNVH